MKFKSVALDLKKNYLEKDLNIQGLQLGCEEIVIVNFLTTEM